MAVSVTTNSIPYTGDGHTTAFSIPFKWLDNADLSVLYTPSGGSPVTWVVGADYTLVGVGVDAGGTLTATTAPATGSALVITRNTPPKQPLSLPAQGPFPASSIEGALDRVTLVQQDTLNDAASSITTLSARVTTDETSISTNTSAIAALTSRLAADETVMAAVSGGSYTTAFNQLTALAQKIILKAAFSTNPVTLASSLTAYCHTGFAVSVGGVVAVYGDSAGGIYSSPSVGAGPWTSRTSNMGGNQVNCIASNGSNLLVAVGAAGACATSPDGVTWTARSGLGSNPLYSAIYVSSLSLWVVVTSAGGVYTSSDGATWTAQTSGYSGALGCLVFGAGVIVATPSFIGAGNHDYITSTNGTAWTPRTFPAAMAVPVGRTNIHFNSTLNLFIGCAGTGVIYSSTDAINWTLRFSAPSGVHLSVAGNANVLIAGDGAGYVVSSFDGLTWTRREQDSSAVGAGRIFPTDSGAFFYANGGSTAQAYSDPVYTP